MLSTSKTSATNNKVIWQNVNELAQGGFTLDDSAFAAGAVVLAGTPIGFDESTRIAKVAKLAVASAAATNTDVTYQVKKGHNVKVGSSIKSGASAAKAVTEIDTTNANYDVIKVGTTLGVAVAIGDAIFIDDSGYSGVKGLLYADVEIDSNGIASAAVLISGTVYDRRISPIPSTIKAKMPLITFSQSY